MTRDTEKCPLCVLTGVISGLILEKKIRAFCREQRNCPYKAGVRRAGFHRTDDGKRREVALMIITLVTA